MWLGVGGGVNGRCVVVPRTSVCDAAKVLLRSNADVGESTVLSMLLRRLKRSMSRCWTRLP